MAETIRPFPDSDLESLDLVDQGNGPPLILIGLVIATTVCTLAVMIARRHRSRAH